MNVLQMLTRFVKTATPNMHSQHCQALEVCVKKGHASVHQGQVLFFACAVQAYELISKFWCYYQP